MRQNVFSKDRREARYLACAALFLIACILCAAASAEAPAAYNGRKIGVVTGSVQEGYVQKLLPDSPMLYFDSYPDLAVALKQGKIDAFIMSRAAAAPLLAENPTLTPLAEPVTSNQAAFGFSQTDTGRKLKSQMDAFLAARAADGTLAALTEAWFTADSLARPTHDFSALSGEAGSIAYGTDALSEPFCYVSGDGYAGFDLDLLYMFCEAYGYAPNIENTAFPSVLAGLSTGVYDMGGSGIAVTEERAQSMLFSIPYYESPQVLIVRGAEPEFASLAALAGKRIGVRTGTVHEAYARAAIANPELSYFSTYADMALALRDQKIDAFLMAEMPMKILLRDNPTLTWIDEPLAYDETAFAFSKNARGEALANRMSEFLGELRASGELEALSDRWMSGGADTSVKDLSALPDENGTLRCGTTAAIEPCSYAVTEGVIGLDVDIAYAFCERYGYGLQLDNVDLSSLLAGLSTGAYDMGFGGIVRTEERAGSVWFSDAYMRYPQLAVVRARTSTKADAGFWAGFADGFEKTFIRESRWKLVLSGLGTTLLISVASALFGTVLGFVLCLARRSRFAVLSGASGALIRLVQGIPSLVLLMVLYYIVFASSPLGGVAVGIVGFSVNFAAYVSEMMRAGLGAVDGGQWEAAGALGLGRAQTFLRVIAPQALRHILPVYKGEFISLVKMTSVVGYIAIQDLTKAGDIIRSRTYDAFFPLIATAAIYFLLAWSLTLLIGLIELRVDPKRRARAPKGVDMAAALAPETEDRPESPGAEAVIRVAHLKKAYPNVTPLADVNVEIMAGDVVTVIGPSGTGKSTFLRCLNRLETPTSGEIEVFGEVIDRRANLSALRQRMGMVFQSFNLFPHLTVIENVMLAPTRLRRASRQAAYESGMRLLTSVGLAEKALAYPDELSGGQKQRAAIARTLAMNPRIILFDEPTSALDPTMVGEVLSVIRALAQKGLTMLIVTHEMQFARDVSTRVFYMDEGEIYEQGAPAQIFAHPVRERTRRFIRRLKVFEASIRTRTFDFIGVTGRLEAYGRKHMMAQRTIRGIQAVFEEICVQVLLPHLPEPPRLDLLIEYAEDTGEARMRVRYNGGAFDPTVSGDELSMAIVRHAVRDIRYGAIAEDGLQNEVEMRFSEGA